MSALVWGDALGCRYRWTDPSQVDSYGDCVRALGNRVDSAVDAFGRVARFDESGFQGAAADSLRIRGEKREAETTELRTHLRGLGRAINAYADSLRSHREALESLRDFALQVGLEVREGRVWPPIEVLPKHATPQDVDAWQSAWEHYRTAFELKREMRRVRIEAGRALLKALADHADVHRDEGDKWVAKRHESVTFGELRREAAEEAQEAVEARDAVATARTELAAAKKAEADAYVEYQRLLRAGASDEELRAHAEQTRVLQGETDAARTALGDARETVAREQREANAAARKLEQAEAGKAPRPQTPRPEPSTDSIRVRDRLG